MNTFNIDVAGNTFTVNVIDDIDQILYEVCKNDETITVIGLNENGKWESNNDCDEKLVKQIGDAIEANEL